MTEQQNKVPPGAREYSLMMHLTDLRDILRYVPLFRDRIFVIAVDGAIVEEKNFRNVLLDIALLRSLRIQVVLVHGGGLQIQKLAEMTGQSPTNTDGNGITDDVTLNLALYAIPRVTHYILEGFTTCDLRGANVNAVIAHPAGILRGVDQQHTGRIDRIDVALIRSMLKQEIVPVVPPLGCDGEGNTFRLSSDVVAAEVALALGAVKLIYLSKLPGIEQEGTLIRQLTLEEAQRLLNTPKDTLRPEARVKLIQAVRATRGRVPRAHIIDGCVSEGLLAEVFSNEGIGTLIHTNEYREIRQANLHDVHDIVTLIQAGVENEELVARDAQTLETQIGDYYLFEVDGTAAGCAALHLHAEEEKAELACVCVDSRFENQGIGLKLVQYLEARARELGMKEIYCLSTQAFNFFIHKAGFRQAASEDLPSARRGDYEKSQRRSRILIKSL